MVKESNTKILYVTLVAVVAIVALIVYFTGGSTIIVDERGNVVGEGARLSRGTTGTTSSGIGNVANGVFTIDLSRQKDINHIVIADAAGAKVDVGTEKGTVTDVTTSAVNAPIIVYDLRLKRVVTKYTDSDPCITSVTSYGSDGKMIKSESYQDDGCDGGVDGSSVTEYSYPEEGVTTKTTTDDNDNDGNPDSRTTTTTTLNEDGSAEMVEETDYGADGTTDVTTTTIFDEDGTSTQFVDNGSDGTIDSTYNY